MNYRDMKQGLYSRDSRIFKLVRELDERGKCATGAIGVEAAHLAQCGAKGRAKRSSAITASKAGTSARIVERIRTILNRGTDELWSLLDSGKITINAAYRQVTENKSSRDKLSVAELFIQFVSMTIPQDRYVRVLGDGELTFISEMAERFRDEGYLNNIQFSKVQSFISVKQS